MNYRKEASVRGVIPLCIEILLQCGDESVDVDFAFAFDRGCFNDK